MSLADTVLAMKKAGCSVEQIAAVAEQFKAAEDAEKEARRAKERAKKARQRSKDEALSPSVTAVPGDNEGQTGNEGTCEAHKEPPAPARVVNILSPNGDINIPPSSPKGDDTARRNRGQRLSESWYPSDDLRKFGESVGLTASEVLSAVDEFRDYWFGVPGAKGCKLDWDGTFRNRLREHGGRKARLNGKPLFPPKAQSNVTPIASRKFRIDRDTPQGKAWEAYGTRIGRKIPWANSVWFFETEWPPSEDQPIAASK